MHHANMSVSNMRASLEKKKKTTSCPSANTTMSSTPHAPAKFSPWISYLEHQILEIGKEIKIRRVERKRLDRRIHPVLWKRK